jgi:TP901 family phage tail tape measure protein
VRQRGQVPFLTCKPVSVEFGERGQVPFLTFPFLTCKPFSVEFMAVSLAELQASIGADDSKLIETLNRSGVAVEEFVAQTNEAVASAGEGFSVLSGRAAAFGLGIAAMAIEEHLTRPLQEFISTGIEVSATLEKIRNNTALTNEQAVQMNDTIMQIASHAPVALEDVAQAYFRVSNFGFLGADATNIMNAAMQSAVATGSKFGTTANALALVMHDFGIKSSEAGAAMNVLHNAAAAGNMTLEELTKVAGKVFSTASAMGLGLADTAGALSALTRAGFPAAQAATALVGAMSKIVNPSQSAKAALEAVSKASGVDLVRDFTLAGLQSKGLQGVIMDLAKATKGHEDAILHVIAAQRGGIGMLGLTHNEAKDLIPVLKNLADVMGGDLTPIQDGYNRMMDQSASHFQILKNNVEILAMGMAELLAPILNTVVDGITKLVNVAASIPAPLQNAALAAGILTAALLPPVLGLGVMVALLGGPVTLAIGGAIVAFGALTAAVALNFNRILEIFGSFRGGVQLNFHDVAMFVGAGADVFAVFSRGVVSQLDIAVTAVRVAVSAMNSAFGALQAGVGGMVQLAAGDFKGAWDSFKTAATTVTSATTSIKDSVAGMKGRLVEDAQYINSHVAGEFSKGFGSAVDKVNEAGGKFDAAMKGIQTKMSGRLIEIPQEVAAKFQKQIQDATQKYQTAINAGVTKAAAQGTAFDGSKLTADYNKALEGIQTAVAKKAVEIGGAIPENIAGGAKKGKPKVDQALKEQEKAVQDMLHGVEGYVSQMGLSINSLATIWTQLAPAVQRALAAQASALAASVQKHDVEIANLQATYGVNVKQINEYLKSIGINFELSTDAILHGGPVWIETIKTLAQAHADAAKTVYDHRAELVKWVAVQGGNLGIVQAMGNAMKAVADLHVPLVDGMKKVTALLPTETTQFEAMNAALKTGSDIGALSLLKLQTSFQGLFDAMKSGDLLKVETDFGALSKTFDAVMANTSLSTEQIQARWQKLLDYMKSVAAPGMKTILDQMAESLSNSKLDAAFERLAHTVGDGMAQMLQKISEALNANGMKVVQWATDIGAVIANIPGKFGDAGRKITQEMNQWYKTIAAVLQLFSDMGVRLPGILNDIFGVTDRAAQQSAETVATSTAAVSSSVQAMAASMGAASSTVQASTETINTSLSQAGSSFDQMSGAASAAVASASAAIQSNAETVAVWNASVISDLEVQQEQWDHWAGSVEAATAQAAASVQSAGTSMHEAMHTDMQQMNDDTEQGAQGVMTKVAGMMAGIAMIISGHSQGGLSGGIQGALGGLMAGAQIGSFFGPIGTGIGAAIGAIGGFFAGLFGGGQSAQQKQQQALQLKQMEADLQKTAVDTANTAISAMKSALEMFNQLADFTRVPQSAIQRFFRQLDEVINLFFSMASEFNKTMVDQAKAFADGIGSVLSDISSGVSAFEALNRFIGVPSGAIERFAAEIRHVIDVMGQITTDVLADGLKHAVKIMNLTSGILEDITAGMTAFTALESLTDIPQIQFDRFKTAIETAVQMMADVANDISNYAVKDATRFAGHATDVMNLISNGVAALTALGTMAAVPAAAVQLFKDGLEMAINAIAQASADISDTALQGADRLSSAAANTVALIKNAIDSLSSIGTFVGVNQAAATLLASSIELVVNAIDAVAERMDMVGVKAGSRFSDAAKSTIDIIKGAVDGLSSLVTYTGVAPQTIARFAEDVEATVTALNGVAARMNLDGTVAAGKFSTAAQTVLNTIKDAVAGLTSLQGYTGVYGFVIDMFAADIQKVVAAMVNVAATISGPALTDASLFAEKSQVIFTAIKSATDAFAALRSYNTIPETAFQLLSADIDRVFQWMQLMLIKLQAALELAIQFQTIATKLADTLKAAFDKLGSIGTVSLKLPGTTGGAGALTLPGGYGSFAAAGAGGGDMYVSSVYLQVNPSDLGLLQQIKDMIARDALSRQTVRKY